nr:hypothetical protein [Clostridium septicum]
MLNLERKDLRANFIPKELEAASLISLALSIPKRPLEHLERSSAREEVLIESISSGSGYLDKSSLEVTP